MTQRSPVDKCIFYANSTSVDSPNGRRVATISYRDSMSLQQPTAASDPQVLDNPTQAGDGMLVASSTGAGSLTLDWNTTVEGPPVEHPGPSVALEVCVIELTLSCKLSMTRDIIVTEMLLAKVERAPRSAGCAVDMTRPLLCRMIKEYVLSKTTEFTTFNRQHRVDRKNGGLRRT